MKKQKKHEKKMLLGVIVLIFFLFIPNVLIINLFINKPSSDATPEKNNFLDDGIRLDIGILESNIQDDDDDDDEEEDDNDDDNEEENDEGGQTETSKLWGRILLLLGIGSAIAVGARYFYKKYESKKRINERLGNEPSNVMKTFKKPNLIDNLSKMGDINITVISPEFLETVDSFDWKSEQRTQFLKEMLSLTPEERDMILQKMVAKSNLF